MIPPISLSVLFNKIDDRPCKMQTLKMLQKKISVCTLHVARVSSEMFFYVRSPKHSLVRSLYIIKIFSLSSSSIYYDPLLDVSLRQGTPQDLITCFSHPVTTTFSSSRRYIWQKGVQHYVFRAIVSIWELSCSTNIRFFVVIVSYY